MKNPWFGFYVADYLAKTSHLTQAQHGAYLLLMLHYYATEQPIPASAMQVHAICRCTTDAERHAASTVLQLFFTREGDIYRHKRIDEELATRSSLRAKRQKAASERWHASAMQVHTQSQSHTHIKPKPKTYVQPTLEEVSLYCSERGNLVDPRKWFDHYSANGWKVGRNSMKDWRAAVRNWERNQVGGQQNVRQASAVSERTQRNREALLAGFGIAPNARSGSPDNPPGDTARRGPLLAGDVQK